MPVSQPTTGALVSRAAALNIQTNRGLAQYTSIQRLIAAARKIQSTIGLSGVAALSSGIAVALCCTVWAIQVDVPSPLAIMAGYCTLIVSACLCAALLLIRNAATKANPPVAKRQPNYAAWKLVSKLSVSDASRLWCDLEPGGPASQESIAWAQAMFDAIKRGELPVIARSGPNRPTSQQEQVNPNWHTEIARDALKLWAHANGNSPRFLQK